MENDKAEEELDDEKLSQSELVEELVSTEKQAPPTQEILPSQFIDRIVQVLSDSIGPIAPLIVRDRLALMGESQDAFPTRRLGELLRAISGEISHEKSRIRFEERILEEVRRFNEV